MAAFAVSILSSVTYSPPSVGTKEENIAFAGLTWCGSSGGGGEVSAEIYALSVS
jgi:hypothetical protein